jgi:hypothetical protein
MEGQEKATPLSEVYWKDYLKDKFPEVPILDTDENNRITPESAIALREFSGEAVKSMCEICIDNQMKQHGKITIKCNGLASSSQLINEEIRHMFSEEDVQQLEEMANPYAWADRYIDVGTPEHRRMFSPRWYQEQMVRCTAKRRAYRCGRRVGKTYSLALNILHRVLTNDNYKVLIVTPYEVQAEELVTQVREFLYRLDPDWGSYNDLVIKDVKSPNYLMQFTNRSRIRGFTTGSSGAGSVRGQSANLIVLDEVDYMGEKDFAAILAILADNPDTELWVASTPDGKKTLFDLEKLAGYKKFHFPTFVLPHYNDNLDTDFKDQLTDVGYIQEIIAEFGASEMGVFQHFYIDKCVHQDMSQAQRDDVLKNRDKYIVILGCDWNDDRIGTRIVALAFDKLNKRFFVAEYETVSKDGWSQVEAVQRIIAMNRRYKFDHLYVDEGFGTSQIQFIKQYALDQFGTLPPDHPDIKLAELVGINFSSKLEVRDVITGQEEKRDMKTYMVENAVRYLERQMFVFDEDYDKDLMAQMGNYIIKSRSPTGRPTFTAEDARIGDHDLDAFMLAVLGFSMEYSQFLNSQVSDLIVKLVSRDYMKGNDELDISDPFDYNPETLFANPGSRKKPTGLFNRGISGYNRSTFDKSTSLGEIRKALPKVGSDGLYRVGNETNVRFAKKKGKGRASFG